MFKYSILFFLFACGQEEKEQDTGTSTDTDTNTDTDTDTDTLEDPCIQQDGATGNRMEGSVIFEDGSSGKGQTRVQMCNIETCFVASWGEDGNFCFPEGVLNSGYNYAFDVVPLIGEENEYATPLSIISISEENTLIQLEAPVLVPKFQNNGAISSETFDAGNGLTLTIGEGEIDGDMIFSASLEPSEANLPLAQFQDRNIIGLWYFGPFEEVTTAPWGFQLSNSATSSLELGSTVELYNASYEDRDWLYAGTATVGEGGVLLTDENSGLQILSTLVLVQ